MSSVILRPVRWWDMVSPQEEEMPDFLKIIALGWRTPKRRWEDLWRLRRGELNHILGMRKFGTIKYQRGILSGFSVKRASGAATLPDLSNIQQAASSVSPIEIRQVYAYDSDGSMRHDLHVVGIGAVTYTDLTTQTSDSNDHTNEWWPDQPETNEGLNWDIQYSNESLSLISGAGSAQAQYFADSLSVNRTTATWYLLDTVSNDHGDASVDGCIGVWRDNGSGKFPDVGLHTLTVDVDIRNTGSGSSVAGHSYDLDVEGT